MLGGGGGGGHIFLFDRKNLCHNYYHNGVGVLSSPYVTELTSKKKKKQKHRGGGGHLPHPLTPRLLISNYFLNGIEYTVYVRNMILKR